MNDYRDMAWPSVDRIAAKCSLSRRAVQTNLRAICESGYLLENGSGPHGTTRYAIGTPEEGGGASAARAHITTKRGASAAPKLTKEVTNKTYVGVPGWDDWEKHRKEIRKKLTPTTIQRQLKFLDGRPPAEQEAIINQSIQNGWTGLFELKGDGHGQAGQNTKAGGKLSGAERTRRAREQLRSSYP